MRAIRTGRTNLSLQNPQHRPSLIGCALWPNAHPVTASFSMKWRQIEQRRRLIIAGVSVMIVAIVAVALVIDGRGERPVVVLPLVLLRHCLVGLPGAVALRISLAHLVPNPSGERFDISLAFVGEADARRMLGLKEGVEKRLLF